MLTEVDSWGLNFSLDFRSKVLTSPFYESCDTEVIMNLWRWDKDTGEKSPNDA